MDARKTVEVYYFRPIHSGAESTELSRFKAPRDVVKRLKGQVVEGTGEEVTVDQLDAEGRYRRIATGWGELE